MTTENLAGPGPVRRGPRSLAGTVQLAETFLRRCADGLGWGRRELALRLSGVRAEIADSGTYRHTTAELTCGAKLAWRQHVRCIGMVYWRSLTVWDARGLGTPDEMMCRLSEHLRWAFNGGRIRPLITVFRPDLPGAVGPRILNRQLVQYAGYRLPDGTIRGDPANVAITGQAQALGWPGGHGRFDRLPVLLRTADGRSVWRELDPAVCPDVPIGHPRLPWMIDLGLRWYAFPTVSDMELHIGGVVYGAAPFSGWYVCTEIGTRNFGDTDRYDMLRPVAERMGMDVADERTLWRDRAITELNSAVLYSYHSRGIKLLDHHTMSAQFHRFVEAEDRAGRPVHADWRWIVPPTGASATPLYRLACEPVMLDPNFHRRVR